MLKRYQNSGTQLTKHLQTEIIICVYQKKIKDKRICDLLEGCDQSPRVPKFAEIKREGGGGVWRARSWRVISFIII